MVSQPLGTLPTTVVVQDCRDSSTKEPLHRVGRPSSFCHRLSLPRPTGSVLFALLRAAIPRLGIRGLARPPTQVFCVPAVAGHGVCGGVVLLDGVLREYQLTTVCRCTDNERERERKEQKRKLKIETRQFVGAPIGAELVSLDLIYRLRTSRPGIRRAQGLYLRYSISY